MNITPDEAARALNDVRTTQSTALRSVPPMFPSWYLSAVWGGVAAIQFVTEVLPDNSMLIGLTLVLAGIAAALVKFIADMRNLMVRPHRSVIDPWAWAGFGAWLLINLLACLGLALMLSAIGFDYPRTGAAVAVFVIALITAPMLPRWMSMRTARRAEKIAPSATGTETR